MLRRSDVEAHCSASTGKVVFSVINTFVRQRRGAEISKR
jgi:hypothetical protein|tara:strand:- start:2111 stop:2227 length:117 start_codon:yes stop_codon:yes gene_type:complete